ncbi:type VII toxin-antitoxin system HepT family RNase toxin [Halosimplex sp. TS25]|uniref:type VII toxin-antitoxin system HepT family RNase toxin n=1 Tax=Halosimplex rarum TaxID=3396619 RepID=UPI0039ECA9C2
MSPTDEMPAERANRIADAVEDVERNVSRLRDRQSLSRDEYKAEGNHDLRDATERKFEKLAEAILDIAEAILKQEDETVPSRRKETIAAVERVGIIDSELSDRLQEAIEFRDVLSQTYGPIVNDDIVYDSLQNALERYVEFVEAVHDYLSSSS